MLKLMESNEVYSINRRLMILESMVIDIYDSIAESKKICPICNNKIRLYLPYGIHGKIRRDAQCPVCRSLERHRALWLYLQRNTDILNETRKKTIKMLHFAPEKCFYDKFSCLDNVDYYPVDIKNDKSWRALRDIVDMQDIQYSDNMFDVIIASHVLEHIPDDKAALKELHRVMKKSGALYVMIPLFQHLAQTLENPEYNTDELRRKHYGQEDHLRAYGRDFAKRLENAGFLVKEPDINKDYTDEQIEILGLVKNEILYIGYEHK